MFTAERLTHRADLASHPELMDGPCTYEELRGCLRDIARVNRRTFAYRPTLTWLGEVLSSTQRPVHIVDVGCGYGDMLRRIAGWARERGRAVRLTGIDRNADAIRAAREATPADAGIEFLAGDAEAFQPEGGIDVVTSSLVTHHMEDAEIVGFLRWMESTAQVGWFINDLHRQAVPYYVFRLLARFSGWHRFVKHDGAVSILRSFRPEDWRRLCGAAGIPAYELREVRPARLCVSRVR